MPWIESHTEIERHRKTLLMAEELGLEPVHLSGHLHALWHAVLEQQEDGNLEEWPDGLIARQAQYKGDAEQFVALLQKHKFLEENRLVHDWLDYAGRYLTNKYKSGNPRKLREILKIHKSNSGRTKVRQKADVSPPTKKVRLGTVRSDLREGGSGGKPPVPQGLPLGITPEDWRDFREARKRKRSPMTPRAEELIGRELCKLEEQGEDARACLLQSIRNGWLGVFPVRQRDGPRRQNQGQVVLDSWEAKRKGQRRGET